MAKRFCSKVAALLVRFAALAAMVSTIGLQQAEAATYQIIAPGIISLEGKIEPGDCDRWKDALVPGLKTVLLNSGGGRVGQGECISRSISHLHLRTVVLQKCASICFLMFAAGAERHVCEGARIGIHRPSIAGTHEELSDPKTLNSILTYAVHYGVPDAVRIRLSMTPNQEVYWMTTDDLRLMDVRDCRST